VTDTNDRVIEYRGYNFIAVEHSPGWRVNIYPGPGRLHTAPEHVSATTKEEALAKARASVDLRLSR
jgi:hypothetical protein